MEDTSGTPTTLSEAEYGKLFAQLDVSVSIGDHNFLDLVQTAIKELAPKESQADACAIPRQTSHAAPSHPESEVEDSRRSAEFSDSGMSSSDDDCGSEVGGIGEGLSQGPTSNNSAPKRKRAEASIHYGFDPGPYDSEPERQAKRQKEVTPATGDSRSATHARKKAEEAKTAGYVPNERSWKNWKDKCLEVDPKTTFEAATSPNARRVRSYDDQDDRNQ
jgi:hypothetical protein